MYGMFADRYLPSISTEAAYRGNACLSDDISCANLDSSFHIHNINYYPDVHGIRTLTLSSISLATKLEGMV